MVQDLKTLKFPEAVNKVLLMYLKLIKREQRRQRQRS